MYQEGQLLKFSNFVFKNGNTPKTKYLHKVAVVHFLLCFTPPNSFIEKSVGTYHRHSRQIR